MAAVPVTRGLWPVSGVAPLDGADAVDQPVGAENPVTASDQRFHKQPLLQSQPEPWPA
jgi:hypothetical protein